MIQCQFQQDQGREKFWIYHVGSYPENIRLDENTLRTSLKSCLSSSSGGVFRRSGQIYLNWSCIFKASWVLVKFGLVKTLWRCLEDVFKMYHSKKIGLINTSSTRFQDVLWRLISTERFALATLPDEFMVRVQTF